MMERIRVLALVALLASLGCDADEGTQPRIDAHAGQDAPLQADVPSDVAQDAGLDDAHPDAIQPPELRLRCISGRLSDTHLPVVLRLEVVASGGGFDLHSERGFQHDIQGPLTQEPDPRDWRASGTVGPEGAFLTWDEGEMAAVPLESPGVVLRGPLTLEPGLELIVDCWAADATPPYRYDATTGRCLDDDGQDARGGVSLAFVSETGLGQCADLSGLALEDQDYYYPALADWDLRGADLRDASLHFADLVDARLQGADLTGLTFGYARILGTVDAYTTLPQADFEGSCVLDGDRLECQQ